MSDQPTADEVIYINWISTDIDTIDAICDGANVVLMGEMIYALMHERDDARAENERLRAALRETSDELAKWGFGDMHYGSQGQLARVSEKVAAARALLGASDV